MHPTHKAPLARSSLCNRTLLGAGTLSASLMLSWPVMAADTTAAMELPALPVSAERIGDDNVDGYVARESSAGSKTDTPVDEVPQSISVITREQIEDQAPLRAVDALRYTPGIAPEVYGGSMRSDTYTGSRGLGLDFYVNDLPVPQGKNYSGWAIDAYLIERAEYLRGPASVLYGQATPGGVLNYVTKQPSFQDIHEIHVEYGTDDWKKIGLDLGGAINDRDDLAYRLVISGLDADQSVDPFDNQRLTIAPSLTWLIDDDTSLTLEAGYYDEDSSNNAHFLPSVGTVVDSPYGELDTDLFTGSEDFETYKKKQYWLGYRFSHDLNDQWQFRQNLRYARTQSTIRNVYGMGAFDTGTTLALARIAADTKPDYERYSLDNQLEGSLQQGNTEHRLLLGLNYEQATNDDPLQYAQAPYLDLYSPTYLPVVDNLLTPWFEEDVTQKLTQVGIYAQDQITFAERWALTLGGRYDWAKTEQIDHLNSANNSVQHDRAFSGRAGLVYLSDIGLNPYLSYSESFEPQLGADADGNAFEPSEAKQYELGVKYAPDQSHWELAAALFDLRKSNVPTTDPNDPSEEVLTGEVRSRGVELSAVGEVLPNLTVQAAYTYQDVVNTKANDDSLDNHPTAVPERMASLWGKYTVRGGTLDGLGIALGVRHIGESQANTENSVQVPAFTLLDAGLSYRVNNNWRLALNGTNLADKEYVSACSSESACFWGPGRRIVGSLTYNW
ncbi:Ferrichrome-iron receptor [Marinobacterium lacunae]|uniref:Ferrichrome-iron receptor n=1 Tax=Marinobacterium lacunae TaxID=1232683 RepID=A0A081FVG1_9GAMM|nr:TonB-dependent siderophore receptor [Marinobacterium lacunae]KEA62516.1 Ferrichrome-iron receptor [Marinobacterium lacunae]MBR9883473.1 TonB-dependent siderophore receptor [Oceanospirillales bacterium]